MQKKRIVIKDKKIKEHVQKTKRENFKKDFFELLKRASKPQSKNSL